MHHHEKAFQDYKNPIHSFHCGPKDYEIQGSLHFWGLPAGSFGGHDSPSVSVLSTCRVEAMLTSLVSVDALICGLKQQSNKEIAS